MYALPYMFAVSAIFVNTTILDIEGDRKCGFRTTGVVLGSVNSARLGLLLIAACIASAVHVRDYVCLVPALLSLPLFIIAAVKGNMKYVLLSIRIGGPLLILAAGIIFPYFLAVALVIFIFLRVYYKRKFGIDYPAV
jgi:4-hydroxybenzoate polyprenyltransferase